MSTLAGLTRENCAGGCSEKGCVIGNVARCCHPLKGGPPIELLNDIPMQEAFDAACIAIGVSNAYKAGAETP